jgi:hypothetical protein
MNKKIYLQSLQAEQSNPNPCDRFIRLRYIMFTYLIELARFVIALLIPILENTTELVHFQS